MSKESSLCSWNRSDMANQGKKVEFVRSHKLISLKCHVSSSQNISKESSLCSWNRSDIANQGKKVELVVHNIHILINQPLRGAATCINVWNSRYNHGQIS